MFPQTIHSSTSSSRNWVALEFSRVFHRLNDFRRLGLPDFEENSEAAAAETQTGVRDERIAPTAITLLGLGEVIFVAFVVGQTYGGLHPVWKFIVGLSAFGFIAMSYRLLRLLKANRPVTEESAMGELQPLNPS